MWSSRRSSTRDGVLFLVAGCVVYCGLDMKGYRSFSGGEGELSEVVFPKMVCLE